MNIKLGILTAAVIIAAALSPSLFQSSYAWVCPEPSPRSQKAPIAVSGDNNV